MALALLLLAISVCLPGAAHANEMQTFVSLDAERSDNPLLTATGNGLAEVELRPSVRIDYLLDYSSLSANLNYSASQSRFRHETFEDRTEILGTGTARLTIAQNLLYWDFYQNRTRLALESREPLTPNNETRRGVIRTGPQLNWALGARTRLQLGANYISSTFDSGSALETDQMQFSAGLSQQVSAGTNLALNYQQSDADSEVDVLKYKSKRAGVTLSGAGRRYEFSLSVGRSTIDRESGTSVSGAYYASTVSVTLAATRFWFSGTRELTDSSLGLSLNTSPDAAPVNGDANFASQDIVLRERYEALVTRELAQGLITLGAVYDAADYQNLTRDEVDHTFYLSVQYPLSPRWNVQYKREFRDSSFETVQNLPPSDFLERNDTLDFVFRPNQRTRFRIGFHNNERAHVLPSESFEEVVVTLMIERRI
ncbi:MAG: hypothetical protein ACFHX7_16950 [Pseudomonadota bacterium]